ncbi:hypothetical protein [Kutzneria sp. 744]|uniref:hypothetical protein n=1 Tax=Kutzneria sp. (strain 744) TaxID=345341 RepID=UPI0003EEAE9A|nr:hypothetical protein [Kutzneria sp. 744]EWM14610.1 hypothetical protein KUTG_04914 [Kutzneria sp. 744]
MKLGTTALTGGLLVLVVVAAARNGDHTTTHTPTPPLAPAAGTTHHPDPTATGRAGTATVTGTEYARDPNNPATGTHYAECRDTDGSEYRVVVSAATEYSLRTGQPCPAGPHLPTVRQQYPELYDELTKPLPYNGGDPDGPCGSWSAVDQALAEQARAAWQRCMTAHGNSQ